MRDEKFVRIGREIDGKWTFIDMPASEFEKTEQKTIDSFTKREFERRKKWGRPTDGELFQSWFPPSMMEMLDGVSKEVNGHSLRNNSQLKRETIELLLVRGANGLGFDDNGEPMNRDEARKILKDTIREIMQRTEMSEDEIVGMALNVATAYQRRWIK